MKGRIIIKLPGTIVREFRCDCPAYEDGMLEMYTVSEDVNSPRHNDKHLVEAVGK